LLLIREAGVDVLVSTLPADEAAEFGLADEAGACQRAGLSYLSYPIPDRETPSSTSSFTTFVDQLRRELHAGQPQWFIAESLWDDPRSSLQRFFVPKE
jgi:hypothetical protein